MVFGDKTRSGGVVSFYITNLTHVFKLYDVDHVSNRLSAWFNHPVQGHHQWCQREAPLDLVQS